MKPESNPCPWYLRPLAWVLAGALLCLVGGLYARARWQGRLQAARQAKAVAAGGCPAALGRDLVRHDLFRYQTRRSLSRDFFARGEAALGDGYLYLVLARSKSPAGEVLGLFTHREYNHISLALDGDLDTLVSYNGGEGAAGPGAEPGERPFPGPAGRGPACGSTACPPPPTRSGSSSAAWGRSTRRAAGTTSWAWCSPGSGGATPCSVPSSSTGC